MLPQKRAGKIILCHKFVVSYCVIVGYSYSEISKIERIFCPFLSFSRFAVFRVCNPLSISRDGKDCFFVFSKIKDYQWRIFSFSKSRKIPLFLFLPDYQDVKEHQPTFQISKINLGTKVRINGEFQRAEKSVIT
ncbi:MAG: hypothetical protein CSA95_02380 [Bacteroidetes bacterium]|nr:MAG: hypothetical protein CSA95_02380 [Bacteroidota bacterium]